MRLVYLIALIHSVAALNILLTATDSWVSKNIRHLYTFLVNEGHTVVLVAPLYNNAYRLAHQAPHSTSSTTTSQTLSVASQDTLLKLAKRDKDSHDESTADIVDGGEFGHLLPVHQTYYKNILRINSIPKRAKNAIHKKELDEFEQKIVTKFNNTRQMGHDPLDANIWYVNSTPLNSLRVAFDVILPEFHNNFVPDVVIVGPNEGSSLTTSPEHTGNTNLEALSMLQASLTKNITTVGISSEDYHQIYFQDEKYFKIQAPNMLKQNVFGKNINFINRKISQLLQGLDLSKPVAVNVNFPSMNHESSRCITSSVGTHGFSRVHNVTAISPAPIVQKFELYDNMVSLAKMETVEVELESSTFQDKRSNYYKHKSYTLDRDSLLGAESLADIISFSSAAEHEELSILHNCGISVNVMALAENLDHSETIVFKRIRRSTGAGLRV